MAPESSDLLGRYRRDGDVVYIDLHLRTARQLFDSRDPSPFRERDIDENAMEYLVGAIEEIPTRYAVTLSLSFKEGISPPCPGAEGIEYAIRQQVDYEIGRARREVRSLMRVAQVSAAIALIVLAGCVAIASALERYGDGHVMRLMREGILILGWVALWRPLETALYDWWPHVARIRTLRRLSDARIEVILPP